MESDDYDKDLTGSCFIIAEQWSDGRPELKSQKVVPVYNDCGVCPVSISVVVRPSPCQHSETVSFQFISTPSPYSLFSLFIAV